MPSSWGRCREEQPLGRKIPADLEVFGEKDYFYKKKDDYRTGDKGVGGTCPVEVASCRFGRT